MIPCGSYPFFSLHMSPSLASSTLFLLFIFLSIVTTSICSSFTIFHSYSKYSSFLSSSPSSSWQSSSILQLASNDLNRFKYLSSLQDRKTAIIPIASGQQTLQLSNYVVRVKLGSPGQLFFMVLDTSNDITFVPCSPCTGCETTVSTAIFFNSSSSTTYNTLECKSPQCSSLRGLPCSDSSTPSSCHFNITYGGDSVLFATLTQDVLRLGLDTIPSYSFACVNTVTGKSLPPQGLLGLGRGSTSLLSQTQSLYQGVFSYCLPSFRSYYFTGTLKLGPLTQPKNVIKYTPLLKNPHRPTLYYVNLTGVTVGKKQVTVKPELLAFDPNTGSGTIIDSGTVISRFTPSFYEAIRDEYRSQVGGTVTTLGAFDTCFNTPFEQAPPAITLHFTGMNLTLPMENTLIHSSAGSQACLAMAASPNNVNSVLNVIANLQQQNYRIVFDVINSRVGISRELCN